MIALEDIEDMTSLTRDEVAALADHEHISLYSAALEGEYLMHIHHGPARVQQMICEDIREALHAGDKTRAKMLFATLRSFMAAHPEAAHGAPG